MYIGSTVKRAALMFKRLMRATDNYTVIG